MNTRVEINIFEGAAYSRRNFLRNTAITVAAAPFGKAAFAAEEKRNPNGICKSDHRGG